MSGIYGRGSRTSLATDYVKIHNIAVYRQSGGIFAMTGFMTNCRCIANVIGVHHLVGQDKDGKWERTEKAEYKRMDE